MILQASASLHWQARSEAYQVLQLVVFTDLQNKIRRNKPTRCLVGELCVCVEGKKNK